MATYDNLVARIQRLIDDGRVYYGQPTKNLEAILSAESQSWYTVIPSNDYLDTHGSKEPWGGRANESLSEMVACAQSILYEEVVSIEHIQEIEEAWPGLWEQCAKKVAASGRGGYSPYAVSVKALAGYCIAAKNAGDRIRLSDLPRDSRQWDWDVVRHFSAGVPYHLLADVEWLGRYMHRFSLTGCHLDIVRRSISANVPINRKLLACAAHFQEDIDAARQVSMQFRGRPLRELLDHLAAIRTMLEAVA